jgi:hypothetical protein
MSETNTNTEGKTFKTVNGKTVGDGGTIRFVRPKLLAEEGTTGIVAQGVYQGTVANNFDDAKEDYKVLDDNGNTIILNSAGSLASQLKRVKVGSYVRISYLGMKPMTKGKMKGKDAHSFIVEIAE